MSKNIVFCADGTWNGIDTDDDGDGVPDSTNVLKFFAGLAGRSSSKTLRLQDEEEKCLTDDASGEVTQVAKYVHGVGDSRNVIVKILGGVFGEGFIGRIVRGYTFVSRHYCAGDRIYLVGFSRGAYTVRALGGMILKVGLLRPEALKDASGAYDADLAYRMGIGAWSQYRQLAGKKSTLFGYLEEWKRAKVSPASLLPDVDIEAIGVWDTVGALGIPVFNIEDRQRIDVFAFADTSLSPRVRRGLHAVSIDEQRGDFLPTLWDPRDGIEQVWFSGAHADVGGGYPQEELSNFALDWMVRRMGDAKVKFRTDFAIRAAQKHIPGNTPWKQPPFDKFPHRPRNLPENAVFHRSVQRRLIEYGEYAPDSLARFMADRNLPPSLIVD